MLITLLFTYPATDGKSVQKFQSITKQ